MCRNGTFSMRLFILEPTQCYQLGQISTHVCVKIHQPLCQYRVLSLGSTQCYQLVFNTKNAHVCIYMFVGKFSCRHAQWEPILQLFLLATATRTSTEQSPYEIFSLEPTQCYQLVFNNNNKNHVCMYIHYTCLLEKFRATVLVRNNLHVIYSLGTNTKLSERFQQTTNIHLCYMLSASI